MVPGASLDRHHWIPRSEGGGDWDWIHQICHRMIHRLFTDRELAGPYSDASALRGHPEMARFIAWVRRKPAEYLDWPKTPRRGRSSRRR
ncbi:MAG: HNH endonuclease [Rhodospirillales bacterium]|nr:HNH endonuclease [Rhodospirillales bacterium]